MPQQRTKKRKRAPELFPSSATLEVISVVRQGGTVVKKRIVETTNIDPRIPPPSFPDDDFIPQSLPIPQAVPSQSSDKQGTSRKQTPANPSHSSSASAARACHVDTRSSTPRPKPKSGFRTGASTSMNSFVWKLPLQQHPVSNVNHLKCIVVSAVFQEGCHASVV